MVVAAVRVGREERWETDRVDHRLMAQRAALLRRTTKGRRPVPSTQPDSITLLSVIAEFDEQLAFLNAILSRASHRPSALVTA